MVEKEMKTLIYILMGVVVITCQPKEKQEFRDVPEGFPEADEEYGHRDRGRGCADAYCLAGQRYCGSSSFQRVSPGGRQEVPGLYELYAGLFSGA